jgi:hypothetical protein
VADDRNKAVKKYREFQHLDPKRIGKFPATFAIPKTAYLVGDAVNVLYRSGKCDPETLKKPSRPVNYIHDHDPGVKLYAIDGTDLVEDIDMLPERTVPQRIHAVTAIVLLGDCLGFGYRDGDDDIDVDAPSGSELYCTPDGRALLVVQRKRRVTALIWGGRLGVIDRGIIH